MSDQPVSPNLPIDDQIELIAGQILGVEQALAVLLAGINQPVNKPSGVVLKIAELSSLVQTILSEIGTGMSKWPIDKHFASWLGLAPHNDISGSKVLRSRTLPTNNRAGQAFRQAATAVAHGPSAFGAYYRRKRAQNGLPFAQVATAHKIARTVYHLLKYRVQYQDIGADGFERKQRERDVLSLQKKAAKLGFTLILPASVETAV